MIIIIKVTLCTYITSHNQEGHNGDGSLVRLCEINLKSGQQLRERGVIFRASYIQLWWPFDRQGREMWPFSVERIMENIAAKLF